jgi:DnaD/phage-associated family protein
MTKDDFLLWEQASLDTVDVKRIYIDIAGDLVTGILLSQIVYWNLPSKKTRRTKLQATINGELYLAKKRTDWWEECRITDRQYDRSIKILIDKGIVKVELKKFDGIPMPHILLNVEILLEFISTELNGTRGEEVDFTESVKSSDNAGLTDFTESVNYTKCEVDITESVKSLTETTTEIINNNNNDEIEKDKIEIPEEFRTTKYTPPQIDSGIARIADLYQNILGRPLNRIECESINEFYGLVGEELLGEAFRRAVEAGIRELSYIRSIVHKWYMKGVKNMVQVKIDDEKRAKNSRDNKSKPEEDKPKPNKYEKFYL